MGWHCPARLPDRARELAGEPIDATTISVLEAGILPCTHSLACAKCAAVPSCVRSSCYVLKAPFWSAIKHCCPGVTTVADAQAIFIIGLAYHAAAAHVNGRFALSQALTVISDPAQNGVPVELIERGPDGQPLARPGLKRAGMDSPRLHSLGCIPNIQLSGAVRAAYAYFVYQKHQSAPAMDVHHCVVQAVVSRARLLGDLLCDKKIPVLPPAGQSRGQVYLDRVRLASLRREINFGQEAACDDLVALEASRASIRPNGGTAAASDCEMKKARKLRLLGVARDTMVATMVEQWGLTPVLSVPPVGKPFLVPTKGAPASAPLREPCYSRD